MSDTSNVALVESFFDAMIEDQSSETARRFIADDVEVITHGDQLDASEFFDSLDRQPTDMSDFRVEESVSAGDEVVVWMEGTGRLTETAFGIEPSGDEFTIESAWCFEIVDGTIQRIRVLQDRAAFYEQLGLLSEDPHNERVRDQYYAVLNRVLRHDLRNSLGIAQAEADTLVERSDPDATAVGHRLARVLEDVLATADTARTLQERAIDTDLEPREVEVDGLLDSVVEEYDEAQDVTCFTESPTEDLRTVRTDPGLLRTVLEELIDNAIEHTDDTVEVTITARPADEARYALELTVSDDGPGIPEPELQPVRDGAETDLLHTSGIGLWIVEWVITRLHGEVSFEADAESGTTVRLLLPDMG